MARKAATKPRKKASQERSRATVDALVEATARILVREGFEKTSTNRIAEVAGVSVSRRKEMRKVDIDVATFICVSAIEAVAHNVVLNRVEILPEKIVRTLVDETTQMVVGYLRRSA